MIEKVDTMIEPTPYKTIYYFAEYQPIFDKYLRIDCRQGIPKLSEIEDIRDSLLILNDTMVEVDQKSTALRLRTRTFPGKRQIVYVSK